MARGGGEGRGGEGWEGRRGVGREERGGKGGEGRGRGTAFVLRKSVHSLATPTCSDIEVEPSFGSVVNVGYGHRG